MDEISALSTLWQTPNLKVPQARQHDLVDCSVGATPDIPCASSACGPAVFSIEPFDAGHENAEDEAPDWGNLASDQDNSAGIPGFDLARLHRLTALPLTIRDRKCFAASRGWL